MQTFFNQNLVHSALHIARYQRGTFEVHLRALNLLFEQFGPIKKGALNLPRAQKSLNVDLSETGSWQK